MKRAQPESLLQQAVIKLLQYRYPKNVLFFSVPNEGARTQANASRLKAMGMLAGVSDILVFWKDGMGAIELKAGKNTLTETQKAFKQRWIALGGEYEVCRSLDDVIHALELWGVQ